MSRLIVVLITGIFASAVAAQTPPATQEKQNDVKSTTQSGAGSSASTQKTAAEQAKNVKESKETAKMTTAQKNAAIKAANSSGVNPNNDAGQAATSAQQKANVAKSKGMARQNTELKTKTGQQALEQELEQKSGR
jgi:hypothetical protein